MTGNGCSYICDFFFKRKKLKGYYPMSFLITGIRESERLKSRGSMPRRFSLYINHWLCQWNGKSFSVANENKTPFDIIWMRSSQPNPKSKGGHSDE